MNRKLHWEQVYGSKGAESVSWFQPHADQSLRLIHNTGLDKNAALIDVGGGASRLVDDLVTEGYPDLTVLDLSATALYVAKQRLGGQGRNVRWMVGDITRVVLQPQRYDIWHDRAVFHFLTDPASRHAYVSQVMRAVRPGGHVIVATFAEDGPEQCSGLPVMRYRPDELHSEFGYAFQLVEHKKEAHYTPAGAVQQFTYCYCRKGSH